MAMGPPAKWDARESEFKSLESVKPWPLIQYLVATGERVREGYQVVGLF